MFKPFSYSATTIAAGVTSGDIAVDDVVAGYTARANQLVKPLNTHIAWDEQHVKAQVAPIKSLLQGKGKKLRLAGVPVGIKDNILLRGLPVTAASKILDAFLPIYDATVVSRLVAEGAVLFGKLNLDEFAMGSSNENSSFGPVKNPWNQKCVPGGSSGGSAAAVAADICPVALGSDTGGSVRQPASFCGVVGLKPTYGRISRYGLIAFGSSLDQIGPITRSVKDAALLLDVMSGRDALDSTCLDLAPTQTFDALNKIDVSKGLKGMRIGILKEFCGDGLEPDVAKAFDDVVKKLRELGAEVKTCSLPMMKYSIATYYILATAEASSNLARYDGVRYGKRIQDGKSLNDLYLDSRSAGFGKEVKQRIMLGTFVLSSGHYDAYYGKAGQARQLIRNDFTKAFEEVDLLVSPTSPTTAFEFGQKSKDSMSMYLSDICTIAANLAGVPAISIPCGFDQKGLPIGLQIMAPQLGEEQLLKGAYIYEQSTNWHQRHPQC